MPEWGGRDIFFYTLQEKSKEQGLTFHKISENFDSGSIISKITYPIFHNDDESHLYDKQLIIAPDFIGSCLNLLPYIEPNIHEIINIKPRIFKRGNIPEKFKNYYKQIGKKIQDKFL